MRAIFPCIGTCHGNSRRAYGTCRMAEMARTALNASEIYDIRVCRDESATIHFIFMRNLNDFFVTSPLLGPSASWRACSGAHTNAYRCTGKGELFVSVCRRRKWTAKVEKWLWRNVKPTQTLDKCGKRSESMHSSA